MQEKSLQDVEKRLNNEIYSYPSGILEDLVNVVNTAADHILNFLDVANSFEPTSGSYGGTNHYTTLLDQKQLALQKKELVSNPNT